MVTEKTFEPAGYPLRLGCKDNGAAIATADGVLLPFVDPLARRIVAKITTGGGQRG